MPVEWLGVSGRFDIARRGQVTFLLQRLYPEMPAPVAEAVTLRRQATLDGRCPCGARMHTAGLRAGHATDWEMIHDRDCPATSTNLAALMAAHGWVTPKAG